MDGKTSPMKKGWGYSGDFQPRRFISQVTKFKPAKILCFWSPP